MKYIVVIVLAMLVTFASAQQVSTQPVRPSLKDVATALTVGWLVSFGAVVTGNVPELCARLRGTYTPAGPDLCPDGQWRYLF